MNQEGLYKDHVEVNHLGCRALGIFILLKESIHAIVSTDHTDPQKILFLLKDASNPHWQGFMTQIQKSNKDLPFEKHNNSTFYLIFGELTGSNSRWCNDEKKAFETIYYISILDHMLLRLEGFPLFGDQNFLTIFFNSVEWYKNIINKIIDKVEHWKHRISGFGQKGFQVKRLCGPTSTPVGSLLTSPCNVSHTPNEIKIPHAS